MKKLLSVLLAVVMLISVFSVSFAVFADHEEDGIYYEYVDDVENAYYYKGGVKQTGWIKTIETWTWTDEDGVEQTETSVNWYYADTNGVLQTGWKKIDSKWYYLDLGGYYMYADQIWWIDEKPYYFDKSGVMQTGWIKHVDTWTYTDYNGEEQTGTSINWYYADKSGVLQQGWQTINKKKYHFADWFGMDTGVSEIDGKYYYFDANGVLQTGWIKKVEKYDTWTYTEWYYADSNGVLQTGWKKIGGKWYYFEIDNWAPRMVSDGTHEIKGKLYLFGSDGALLAGGWQKVVEKYSDGTSWTRWYYTDKDGVVQTGWKKIDGKWYYFDEEMCANGGRKIDEKIYLFEKDGTLTTKTGWVKLESKSGDKTYTNWYYVSKGGVCAEGWKKIGGKWYYFDTWSGNMYKNGGYAIFKDGEESGKVYLFEKDGTLSSRTGWASIKSEYNDKVFWFYVTKGGICKTGWQKIGGKWYFFDDWGYMATGIFDIYDPKTDTNTVYFFDDNGVWQSKKAGWASEKRSTWNGEKEVTYTAWFYFVDGKGLTNKWKKIGGKWYYFGTYGEMYFNGTYNINDKNYKFDKNGVCLNP